MPGWHILFALPWFPDKKANGNCSCVSWRKWAVWKTEVYQQGNKWTPLYDCSTLSTSRTLLKKFLRSEKEKKEMEGKTHRYAFHLREIAFLDYSFVLWWGKQDIPFVHLFNWLSLRLSLLQSSPARSQLFLGKLFMSQSNVRGGFTDARALSIRDRSPFLKMIATISKWPFPLQHPQVVAENWGYFG